MNCARAMICYIRRIFSVCYIYVAIAENGLRTAYATDEPFMESKYAYFRRERKMVFSGMKRSAESVDEAIGRVLHERRTVKGIVSPASDAKPRT